MPMKDFFLKWRRKRGHADNHLETNLKRQSAPAEDALPAPQADPAKTAAPDTSLESPAASSRQARLDLRIRQAAESVLENESLSSDLDDRAAKALLDWGIAGAEKAARGAQDLDDEQAEAAMHPRLRANRKLMRSVNNLLTRGSELSPDEQALLLDEIAAQAVLVYAGPDGANARRVRSSALTPALDPGIETAQAVRLLREIIEAEIASPSAAPLPSPPALDPPGGSSSGDIHIT